MSSAAPAIRAVAAASSEDVTAADDVGIGTAVSVKAVATTPAALREHNKVWAEERRSSARASFLIRGEIQFLVVQRNRQGKSVMQTICVTASEFSS